MSQPCDLVGRDYEELKNGSGAASVLAAGIGCFMMAVLAIFGDKSAVMKNSLNFYKPAGPLSGVTTVAIVVWLGVWGILDWNWRKKTVRLDRINVIALALLVLSLILTFPPVGDLFSK